MSNLALDASPTTPLLRNLMAYLLSGLRIVVTVRMVLVGQGAVSLSDLFSGGRGGDTQAIVELGLGN